MPIIIASLNSGSNGNSYYIGNSREAVLVDAGISCRETERRLKKLDLSVKKIRAVFISHEHTDHTRGIEVISRRHRIPVYISPSAYQNSRLAIEGNLLIPLEAYVPVQIGGLVVNAFPKLHDAREPFSFTVTGDGITAGVFTDIGMPCEHVIQNFRMCHAAFLESNYDEVMLEEGRYPPYLKKRIRSDHGHLSNSQALELFLAHKPPFMSHLLLSHLSQDNNDPQLVLGLFGKHANGVTVSIASRYGESQVFSISGSEMPAEHGPAMAPPIVPAIVPAQGRLF